jgi:hypothetical protein
VSAIPRKTAFLLPFSVYALDGSLKSGIASSLVTAISKDGAASAATTNAATEPDPTNQPGRYTLQLTATEMDAQALVVSVTYTGYILGSTYTVVTDPDIYTAKLSLTIDTPNTTDRWAIDWFKNGVPYAPTAGTPQIHVVKASDGSDLIAATNMTQIGATGRWKYDAVTTQRVATGATYYVTLTATVDGSTRTWDETKGVSRDG